MLAFRCHYLFLKKISIIIEQSFVYECNTKNLVTSAVEFKLSYLIKRINISLNQCYDKTKISISLLKEFFRNNWFLTNFILEWISRFNVGPEFGCRLLTMAWKSPLRVVWRHTITILIFHETNGYPALAVRQSVSEVEHLTVEQILIRTNKVPSQTSVESEYS